MLAGPEPNKEQGQLPPVQVEVAEELGLSEVLRRDMASAPQRSGELQLEQGLVLQASPLEQVVQVQWAGRQVDSCAPRAGSKVLEGRHPGGRRVALGDIEAEGTGVEDRCSMAEGE